MIFGPGTVIPEAARDLLAELARRLGLSESRIFAGPDAPK
jgi:hypothetical protein